MHLHTYNSKSTCSLHILVLDGYIMIHSCPLKCDGTHPWIDLQYRFQSCAIDLLPVFLFLFFFFLDWQILQEEKKNLYNYSPLEEQAITLNSSFIKRDGGKKKHQRNWNHLQSYVTSLSFFLRARASVLCYPCAKLCEGPLSLCSESLGETVSWTGLVTVSGWDRCPLDERRPVTRSRSPAWACAPRGCVEGRGKGPACTGTQPAAWGPVRPTRRTWTSRTRGWCPLVSRTCSGGSGTVQSWSRPHMCRGRLCSMSLAERWKEKTSQTHSATPLMHHFTLSLTKTSLPLCGDAG